MSGATSSTTLRLNLLPDFPGRKLIYHPLNSLAGEIRVIVLLHAAEREAPLRCFLKTISIHEEKSSEPYSAISYYWGSTEDPETVEVYGGSWGHHQFGGSFKIPITSNLALALRQFRAHATAERQRLVIWTDALCINQTDTEERSAQVGIMRDIYKAAHSVWTWVGGTSSAAETGLHNLYWRANDTQRSKIFTEVSPNARLYEMMALQLEAVGEDKERLNELIYLIIVKFGDAAYWRRGWIIQEATANNNTYICYGPARYRIISWKLLLDILHDAAAITQWRSMDLFVSHIRQLGNCQSAWRSLGKHAAERVEKHRNHDSECPMIRYYLLIMFTANCWHTSDPRDRVNAIMSAMPLYYTLGFQPDYSKSTEDVFISATVHFLRTGRSWSHLQFLAPSGSPYLPSWAIDFTEARSFDDWGYSSASSQQGSSYWFHHALRMFDTGESRFRADAKTPFRLRQMSQGVLETAGFIVDKVVSVSSWFTAILDCTDDAKSILRAWYRFLMQNKRYIHRNTTLRGRERKWEAFCRTLCVGIVDKLPFDASHAQASEALWDMVIHDRQRHHGSTRGDAQELYDEMELALLGARFIVTRKGRIGVAPPNVAAGDSIGVMSAGDVPFVLRQVKAEDVPGDAYILLGGCYIDGKTSGASSYISTADRNRNHVWRSRRRGS